MSKTEKRSGFSPVFDRESRILILGTMPSPKSLEEGFYYGHPRNRFWHVLSHLLKEPLPCTNEERTALLLRHHIALWDVLQSCAITGAADASIHDEKPNDFSGLLRKTKVKAIFTTGGKAYALYRKHCRYPLPVIPLPSTSPANAGMSLEKLTEAYRCILPYLE